MTTYSLLHADGCVLEVHRNPINEYVSRLEDASAPVVRALAERCWVSMRNVDVAETNAGEANSTHGRYAGRFSKPWVVLVLLGPVAWIQCAGIVRPQA